MQAVWTVPLEFCKAQSFMWTTMEMRLLEPCTAVAWLDTSQLFHVCYFTSIIYSVPVTHAQPPGYLKEVKPSSYFNVGCKGHHVWEPTWWSWSWHVPLCTPSAICSYGRSAFPLLPCVCVCAHVCVLPFLLENEVFQDWDHDFLIFEQVCHGACYMVVLEIVCWPAFHKLRILT